MPVLSNARHERFAQEMAQGKTATEAYIAAGYKADDGNASKLAGRPDVQARVQEITGAAAERVGVTVESIVAEIAKIGFANMLDFMQIGPDGRPYHDFSKLTREQASAISELIVESVCAPKVEGEEPSPPVLITKTRFKLHDKRAALVDLGKHLGMFVERTENLNTNYVVSGEPVVSMEEWAKRHAPKP